MPAAPQVSWARKLLLRTFQRLKMLGIDRTCIRAFGRLLLRVFIAVWKRVRKSVTLVIAASLEVHTSFAPMRIRTKSGLVATAFSACPFRSATLAPVTALFVPADRTTVGLIALTR